jgi:hypothetical protein
VQAWRRLSSLDRAPQAHAGDDGYWVGKTEAFLIPVLDHCRRAKQAAGRGVKAVLLYPMNALATDPAMRINDLLTPRAQGRHRRAVHRRGAGHSVRQMFARRRRGWALAAAGLIADGEPRGVRCGNLAEVMRLLGDHQGGSRDRCAVRAARLPRNSTLDARKNTVLRV